MEAREATVLIAPVVPLKFGAMTSVTYSHTNVYL